MSRPSFLWLVLLLGLSLLQSASTQGTEPIYTILAPKVFRPSSVYNATVTVYNVSSPVNLTLTIQAKDNNKVLVQKETILTSDVPMIESLMIPDAVPETDYILVAFGDGGFHFNDSKTVTVKRKTLSIFVQTDKAMYKPGQTVLFRAIVVHPDLKPYQGTMDIEVFDLAGNKIMQWLLQRNDSGVISKSVPLSNQTPLGDWQIVVTAGENSFKKTFQVAEYVLPKFEVEVILPQYFLINNNRRDLQENLLITVIAKYTYGQPVKGRANVTFQVEPNYPGEDFNYTKKSLNVELVDGKSDIKMTIGDILALAPIKTYIYSYNPNYTEDPWFKLSYRKLLVIADVNETVTGKILSGNATVPFKTQKYDLTFMSISPNNFKPGLVYSAYLQLLKSDGSPPDLADIRKSSGQFASISMSATFSYPALYDKYGYYVSTPSRTENFNITIDPSGYMGFSISIDDNATNVMFLASYDVEVTNSSTTASKSVNVFTTRDNQTIQISFDSPDGVIRALQQVNFTVSTNGPITTFQYEILSKGCIQLSENIVGSLSTEHSFSLWINKDLAMKLAPSARIVVWFITRYGEIVADSLELTVSDGFANEVSMSFDRNETMPSQNVSLTISAHRGSSVFMLAVDQSVLLLKGGNDISENMVFEDLKGYDSKAYDYNYPIMPLGRPIDRKRRSIWWPVFIGGSDSSAVISNAGLLMMTNAHIVQYSYDNYPLYAMRPPGVPGVGANPGMPALPADRENNVDQSKPPAASDQPRVKFPETWIWSEDLVGLNGNVTICTSVPDTITSWIASAFAVSPEAGLGIASETAKLTVFKQFFLSPNLPYSIIHGEEFALPVTVFNYMMSKMNVLVTVQPSTYFKVKGASSVSVQVDSNDAASVYFWIVAEALGQIPIHITGQSPVAGDSVIVMLLVKPEGVPQQYSTSVFIQLSSVNSTFNTTMSVSLPPSGRLVPGSEYAEVTAIGDIMGPSVNGLDNLLQMPYGCGEQNMLTYAPDVYIVKYLSISNQLTADIKSKALGFMNAGYQRELTYQRSDGSFSAFGDSDPAGSVWLSSFVIKCFHQSKDHIPIDDSKIARTMAWIIRNQAPKGSFAEPPNGRVIHVDMQGGSSKGLSLTAYVLIALLENIYNSQIDLGNLTLSITLAQTYLESQIEYVSSDPYALSIISYALAKANSSRVYDVLQKLESLAKIEAGTKHWEKKSDDDSKESNEELWWRPPYQQARSVNIEMTAYALLTYCQLKNLSMTVPIVKWIVAQRNENGGFSSTQDTVVALEALAEFAALIYGGSGEHDLLISTATDYDQFDFLPIKSETAILLQSHQIPSNSSRVLITATGKGSALVQLNVRYNVYKTDDNSGIDLKVNSTQDGNTIIINSCSRWKKKEGSGMVVMEINQLTGFKASNADDLRNENVIVKRVEDSDKKVVVYFDELTSNETCVKLILAKVFLVSNVKDASIKVYPYYEPSGARTQFYGAPQALSQNNVTIENTTVSSTTVKTSRSPASSIMSTTDHNSNSSNRHGGPCMLLSLAIVFIEFCFIRFH